MPQNIIKTTVLVVSYLLFLLPWQQCTNLKFAISFDTSFIPQTQSFFLTQIQPKRSYKTLLKLKNMRVKVCVAISTNIKTLVTPLLLNEINSKLGYRIVTAYTLISQEMVNISCKTPIFCEILKININYPQYTASLIISKFVSYYSKGHVCSFP